MDHSINSLNAAVKSLTDAVAPAVDETDPLARQQLALVVDFLDFLRDRLPYLHKRSWVELVAARELAEGLVDDVRAVDPETADKLTGAAGSADSLISRPSTTTTELDQATAELQALLRDVVRQSVGAPEAVRRRLARAVIRDSEASDALYHSWYVPLGFDPYPERVEPLADVLDGVG
jgi:hypothetical protein